MARVAAPSVLSRVRAFTRVGLGLLAGLSRLNVSPVGRSLSLAAAAFLVGLTIAAPTLAADAVKGEASFSTANGYARLLFKFSEDVASEVTTAGSIVVIRFERPVEVAVERLAEGAPDYISSVRRDPDGMAIRMSLV